MWKWKKVSWVEKWHEGNSMPSKMKRVTTTCWSSSKFPGRLFFLLLHNNDWLAVRFFKFQIADEYDHF